jgi:hypothetical protein
MNDSCDQHAAQTPSPDTGSRHETHSVGKAMSSAVRTVAVKPEWQAAQAAPSLPFHASLLSDERDDAPAPVPIR